MSLIAILGAFLLEQVFPLSSYTQMRLKLRALIDRVEEAMPADRVPPWMTFMVIVLAGAALAWLIGYVIAAVHPFLGLLYTMGVLYLTIGIRQTSHYYSKIRLALNAQDDATARASLTEWLQEEAELTGYRGNVKVAELNQTQLIRQTLEMAILASLRYVFAGLFWFLVLVPFKLGVAGVVFYRLADLLARRWQLRAQGLEDDYTQFARRAMGWIEYLPARFVAATFAIVGNFEDADQAWRTQSHHLRQFGESDSAAVVLSAGAGALGVTLRSPIVQPDTLHKDEHEEALFSVWPQTSEGTERPVVNQTTDSSLEPMELESVAAGQIGLGSEPTIQTLNSGVGVFWRATIFILLALMMLTLTKVLA